MSKVSVAVAFCACRHFSRSVVTLLGVARSLSDESHACMAESKLRRRHGLGLSGWFTLPFALAGQSVHAYSLSGGSQAGGLAASGAMPPFPCPHRRGSTAATHNKSIDADPQQQDAAPPRVLVVRSFLR
jgi:hypothetical protein